MPETALPHHGQLGDLGTSRLGLGCAGMSNLYGPRDERESVAALRLALDLGITFLDTADSYGPPAVAHGHNEELVGKAIRGRRDQVTIATKFGISLGEDFEVITDGRPENVRTRCEESLRRLGIDVIDLYFMHRVDPTIPIEEPVGAMSDLVAAGKVRHLGLCEVSARTLERAIAVHPIAAIENEWSLWTRDIEEGILDIGRRLGVGVVAYAPLGRGFLTGRITSEADVADKDLRTTMPRFHGENLRQNVALLAEVRRMADELGCTPGQLALAWLLAQGHDVVPIPGMERQDFVRENAGAAAVELSAQALARIEAVLPPGAAAGARYGGAQTTTGDTPELFTPS